VFCTALTVFEETSQQTAQFPLVINTVKMRRIIVSSFADLSSPYTFSPTKQASITDFQAEDSQQTQFESEQHNVEDNDHITRSFSLISTHDPRFSILTKDAPHTTSDAARNAA